MSLRVDDSRSSTSSRGCSASHGLTNDVRDLLDESNASTETGVTTLAIDIFVRRCHCMYIELPIVAELDGAEAIVFSAGTLARTHRKYDDACSQGSTGSVSSSTVDKELTLLPAGRGRRGGSERIPGPPLGHPHRNERAHDRARDGGGAQPSFSGARLD